MTNNAFIAALKLNKRWADALSILSIALVVGLMSVTSFLADSAGVTADTRVGIYITMATVIIVVCVWQAAAFAAAAILRDKPSKSEFDLRA